jgi:O-antigen ligase
MQPEALIWNFVSMGKKLEARATVIQTDPNIFASHYFMPIFFVVSIFMSIDLKRKWRFLALGLFIIYFAGVISTFSRSAWVSIFIGLILLILLKKQYKMVFLLLFAGVVALFVFPYSKIIISNIFTRLLDIFAGTGEASSRVRLILAMGALHMIFDSYLLGIGFRGFPVVFQQYEYSKHTLAVYEPHSVFYAIFAELGLFGFLIYIWIVWKIGYYALQNFKESTTENEKIISGTLFVSYVTYIVFYEFYGGGLVDNNLWLIISLILSFRYLIKGMKDREVFNSLS